MVGSKSGAIGHGSVRVVAGLGEESIPNPSPLGLRATEGLGNTSRYSLKSHRLSHRPPQLFCSLFSLPASVDSDQEENEEDQA